MPTKININVNVDKRRRYSLSSRFGATTNVFFFACFRSQLRCLWMVKVPDTNWIPKKKLKQLTPVSKHKATYMT